MIEKVQLVRKGDHFEGKILFSPTKKALDIREVRKALKGLVEEVWEGIDTAQNGGFRGFWNQGRLQEIVIESKAQAKAIKGEE